MLIQEHVLLGKIMATLVFVQLLRLFIHHIITELSTRWHLTAEKSRELRSELTASVSMLLDECGPLGFGYG